MGGCARSGKLKGHGGDASEPASTASSLPDSIAHRHVPQETLMQITTTKPAYRKYARLLLNGFPCTGLVDSGNLWECVISPHMLQRLGIATADLEAVPIARLATAKTGSSLEVLGRVRRPLQLQFLDAAEGAAELIHFRPVVIQDLAMEVNLSGPFLRKHGINQLHTKDALDFRGAHVPLIASLDAKLPEAISGQGAPTIWTSRLVEIPPRKLSSVSLATYSSGAWGSLDNQLLVSHPQLHGLGVEVSPAVQKIDPRYQTHEALLYNPTRRKVTLPALSQIGHLETGKPSPPPPSLVPSAELAKSGQAELEGEPKDLKNWLRKEFRLDESPCLQDPQDTERALQLLTSFPDVFSRHGEFGQTTLVKHAIHTTPGPPIKSRYRPPGPGLEGSLFDQLCEWLHHGVIEPSISPWCSALVPVKKKNGTTRWCVDFRRLNDVTIKDSFPMPHVDDTLSRLARSTIFSSIDGAGAFHVVELEEDAKPKTAFATPWGLYQFIRMPFGLCNAPATYMRLMQVALRKVPLTQALPYMDDTLVHAATLSGHLAALRAVLQAHKEAGLKLQPSKCHLFKKEVDYLGHTISARGVRPVAAYVEAVKNWPLPATLRQLRAFLGKVGYYRRFIKDFARIAQPLTEALHGMTSTAAPSTPITTTPAFQSSFERLRRSLVQGPILAHPRFDTAEPFIVDTDWSQDNHAIGAVLSQVQDGKERVIAYGARKLTPGQANYPVHKGELCAVIFFLQHWRYYLQWKPFILRTDHQALTWIRSMKEPSGMIMRWLDILASYEFEVQHRPGTRHGNADGLSRHPDPPALDSRELGAPEEAEVNALTPLIGKPGDPEKDILPLLEEDPFRVPTTSREWKKAQWRDPTLRKVREWLESGNWPDPAESRLLDPETKYYVDLRGQLRLNQGVICISTLPPHDESQRNAPVVPGYLQDPVIKKAHYLLGHRAASTTLLHLLPRCYFPRMRQRVHEWIKGCLPCQIKDFKQPRQKHTYASAPVGNPFQKISIDYVGPLPKSKQGSTFLLTVRDVFTRWPEAFPMSRATAEHTAAVLENEIFARYGVPDIIHNDRGTQFTSRLMEELSKILDVQISFTPAYNPQSNPVERFHRDLKTGLRATMAETGQDWETLLPQLLFAGRIAHSEAIGTSPFEALFGRLPSVPLGLLDPPPEGRDSKWTPTETKAFLAMFRDKLHRVWEHVRKHQDHAIQRRQMLYRAKPSRIEEDSRVWLYTPPRKTRDKKGKKVNKAFSNPWTGPWRVIRKVASTLFEIRAENADTTGPKDNEVVSLNRLREYYAPTGDPRDFLPSQGESFTAPGDEGLGEIPSLKDPGQTRPAPGDDDDDDDPGWWAPPPPGGPGGPGGLGGPGGPGAPGGQPPGGPVAPRGTPPAAPEPPHVPPAPSGIPRPVAPRGTRGQPPRAPPPTWAPVRRQRGRPPKYRRGIYDPRPPVPRPPPALGPRALPSFRPTRGAAAATKGRGSERQRAPSSRKAAGEAAERVRRMLREGALLDRELERAYSRNRERSRSTLRRGASAARAVPTSRQPGHHRGGHRHHNQEDEVAPRPPEVLGEPPPQYAAPGVDHGGGPDEPSDGPQEDAAPGGECDSEVYPASGNQTEDHPPDAP